MGKYNASDVVAKKEYKLNRGINGKISAYKDGTKGFFWYFPFGSIYKDFLYEDKLVRVKIKIDGVACDDIKIGGYFKGNSNIYRGHASNAKFVVELKDVRKLYSLNTPYKAANPIKTVLTQHPSKYRSVHGNSTGVSRVYKAGGMK